MNCERKIFKENQFFNYQKIENNRALCIAHCTLHIAHCKERGMYYV